MGWFSRKRAFSDDEWDAMDHDAYNEQMGWDDDDDDFDDDDLEREDLATEQLDALDEGETDRDEHWPFL